VAGDDVDRFFAEGRRAAIRVQLFATGEKNCAQIGG
jgi:hypothetical protein